MEWLSNTILNRLLLLGCFLLLASSIVAALIAGIYFLNAASPAVDNGYVSVAYVPLTPLAPDEVAPGTPRDFNDRPSPEDVGLREQAIQGCQSLGRIASAISDKRLDLHGSGLINCEKVQAATAKEFGPRAINYLSESASYFSQLASDPHLAMRYPDTSNDDQTRQILDDMARGFTSKFQAQIRAQSTKNNAALADATKAGSAAMTAISIAGIIFLGFVCIAFLIVLLRIEKHLKKLCEPEPSALEQTNVAKLPLKSGAVRLQSAEFERASNSSN